MWKRAIAVCVVLASCSCVMAGAIIDVVPVGAPPYAAGQRVEVQVFLSQQQGGQDRYLRLIQLDFEDTDPALVLDESFTFDYSGQALCVLVPEMCGYYYADFPSLVQFPSGGATPSTVYMGGQQDPDFQIRLPAEGSIPIGTIGVTLPTVPGDYLVDVLNADTSDPLNYGARIHFGFGRPDPMTAWTAAGAGEIAGGRFTAGTTADAGLVFGYTPIRGTIVPEPTSLLLISLGGIALLRSRPHRRQH